MIHTGLVALVSRLCRGRRAGTSTTDVRAQLAEVNRSRARLVTAADEERRRLERDLHDGAQQSLLGVGMSLQAARREVPADGPAARMLDEATDRLRDSLAELRAVSRGLRPAMLAERGLAAALAEFVRLLPIPVDVDVEPIPRRAEAVEAAVYALVADALRAVVGQAGATRATVVIRSSGGRLQTVVAGSGIGGVDPTAGLGLVDRVAALGGRLRVAGSLAGGTQIVLDLPYTVDLTGAPGGGP